MNVLRRNKSYIVVIMPGPKKIKENTFLVKETKLKAEG
jgi:hypothetical protein